MLVDIKLKISNANVTFGGGFATYTKNEGEDDEKYTYNDDYIGIIAKALDSQAQRINGFKNAQKLGFEVVSKDGKIIGIKEGEYDISIEKNKHGDIIGIQNGDSRISIGTKTKEIKPLANNSENINNQPENKKKVTFQLDAYQKSKKNTIFKPLQDFIKKNITRKTPKP